MRIQLYFVEFAIEVCEWVLQHCVQYLSTVNFAVSVRQQLIICRYIYSWPHRTTHKDERFDNTCSPFANFGVM